MSKKREANICDIIEALEEREKAESEEVREDDSTNALILNCLTDLNHVTHLKQFLMNKKLSVLENF